MGSFFGHSETFWVGVQALFAVPGFIVLFLYTVYTRRMMKLAEDTRRAELVPIVIPVEVSFHNHVSSYSNFENWMEFETRRETYVAPRKYADIKIRNVGRGHGIFLEAWYQAVGEGFKLMNDHVLKPGPNTSNGTVNQGELLRDASADVQFTSLERDVRWLFVISCTDAANGRHQLQVVREAGDSDEFTWKMVHSLGESSGDRFVGFVRKTIEWINALEAESRRLS